MISPLHVFQQDLKLEGLSEMYRRSLILVKIKETAVVQTDLKTCLAKQQHSYLSEYL
jgi:hypothetical protein